MQEANGAACLQQCWLRETANLMDALPAFRRPAAKRQVEALCPVDSREAKERAFGLLQDECATQGGQAGRRLSESRDRLLAFRDFPVEQWEQLRTTAVIQSMFSTVRRGKSRAGAPLDRDTALTMALQLILAYDRTEES